MKRRLALQIAAFPSRLGARPLDVPALLAAASLPGAVYLEVRAGRPPQITPWGLTAHVGGTPLSASTPFALASLSKQFTAYAALREPRLDLDRPLDEFPSLTPRHLLSHSSGWPNWRFQPGEKLVPAAQPGRAFRYSGEGYVYLQGLLEKLSGQPFAHYLRDRVFTPLGLASATFEGAPPPRAEPHNRAGEVLPYRARGLARFREVLARWNRRLADLRVEDQIRLLNECQETPLPNWFPVNAAASLEISPADYAKFLAAALAEPRFNQPLVPLAQSKASSLSWGLGWGIEQMAHRRFWWQWGDNGGFKNFVWVDPAAQTAYAVFTNGDKGRSVYERILRERTRRDPAAFVWLG